MVSKQTFRLCAYPCLCFITDRDTHGLYSKRRWCPPKCELLNDEYFNMKHHLDGQHYLIVLSSDMHNTIQYTKEQYTHSNNTQNVLRKCMFIHLDRFVNELVARIPFLWTEILVTCTFLSRHYLFTISKCLWNACGEQMVIVLSGGARCYGVCMGERNCEDELLCVWSIVTYTWVAVQNGCISHSHECDIVFMQQLA